MGDRCKLYRIKGWATSAQSPPQDISGSSNIYRKIRIAEESRLTPFPFPVPEDSLSLVSLFSNSPWVIPFAFLREVCVCRHGGLATHHGCLIFLLPPSSNISHEELLIRAVARWWDLHIPSSSCSLCMVSGGVLTPGSIFTCEGFTLDSDLIHRMELSKKQCLGDCY